MSRHIGLNLIFLVPGETGGMEVAARELVSALARRASGDLRFTAFVNREVVAAGGLGAIGFAGCDGPNAPIDTVKVPVSARNRLQWVRGEQLLLPGRVKQVGCDLVHSLASTAPIRGRFARVATIHDLNYLKVPDAHFGLRGLGMRVLVPVAARTSDRVIVLAGSTVEDLVTDLGVPRARIDVVPHGVRPPAQAATPTPADELRARLDLGERRILLSASAKRPHKNLLRLIDAVAALGPERPLLVIPGYPTPHEAELLARSAALGITGDVRLPAWVSDADLEGLYAEADAFVFPSLYEGFGLPVLEAMARGVPVACSDRASLPEVVGDGGLLFNPEDVGGIVRALRSVLHDEEVRHRLRRAGPARAASFTWERSAALTEASYRRALAPGSELDATGDASRA